MKKILTLCSAAILSFSSCAVHVNNFRTPDFIRKKSDIQTISLKDVRKINIDIQVGGCSVIFDDTAESTVNVDYEFRAMSETNAENLMNSTEMRCETKGDTLCIDFINSETGREIENKNSLNIVTDIKIVLPESDMSFDISADVGDINVSGFSGAFNISSDVGDIKAKDLTVTGKSDFSADVGSINCEICGLSADKLNFTADVGDIDLSLDTVEKSQVNIESDIGSITLDTHGKSYEETYSKKDTVEKEKKIIIDGKCAVEMKANVGDIKIRGTSYGYAGDTAVY